MDEFANLGRLGLGSRLKRISDYMFSEVNAFYKENGIEFEASTFPLLRVVHKYEPVSLREAQHKLGVTHAAVSQKAKALHKNGLVTMRADRQDQRSKLLRLTEKGNKLVDSARPCWEAMDRTIAHMLYPEEQQLFRALNHLERKIAEKPLHERIYEHFAPGPLEDITIVGYGIGLKPHFRRLNEEWLDKQFSVEKIDEEMFENPRQTILDKGGDILFARCKDEIIGTCALLKQGDSLELAKMSVDPRYRGRGLGRQLIAAAIDRARSLDAARIFLLTSAHLQTAVALYKTLGFTEAPLADEDKKKYGRADIRMEMPLRRP